MDIWILFGLLMLAIPVAAVAGLVLGLQSRGRIESLQRRVATLERELARRPVLAAEFSRASDPSKAAEAPPATESAKETAIPPAAAPKPAQPPRSPVPPARAPKPAAPGRSFEELIGARWTVIVGGLALALGGVFLVRYSIEQGWIGPAARIAFGALFSAGLLALGEKMRRGEAAKGSPRRPIDIPAVVTAAGATSAFATVYAAYALYGFLPPAVAFVALGAVAVATLVAAALHGPILGAIGILGAYAAPALVSTDEPNPWALYIYLLAPTAAAFAVARMRNWPLLAVAAGIAAFLWGGLALVDVAPVDAGVLITYAAALIALAALMHTGASAVPPAAAATPDAYTSTLISLFGLLAAAAPAIDGFGATSLGATGVLLLGLLGLGAWAPGLAPVAAVGAGLAALVALSFDNEALTAVAEVTSFPDPGATARTAGVADFLGFACTTGAAYLAAGAIAARNRPAAPAWWTGLIAAAAVAAPLLLLAIGYWLISEFEPDLRFATIAVMLAAAFAGLAEDAARREPAGAASPMATAAYAVGASAALGLALAMAMREGALTVALAFLAMALGFVAAQRPIRALGWLAIAASAIVLARIALDPRIVGENLGTTPVFNALLWGYGAPMVAFWLGARQFDKAGQRWPAQVLEGLALLFALLLGFMQARHLAHGGDMYAATPSLLEAGLDATVAFGLAAVAGRLGLDRATPMLKWGALVAGGIGVVIAALGLTFGANPLITGESVGDGLILNQLIPGYLVPAVAVFLAARFTGEGRPVWVRRALGGVALALAFNYLSLMVRRVFGGPAFAESAISDPEWYAYSVVWLVFGLALLGVGVLRRSQMLRLASALIIVAVILKVFLIDLSEVGGVWRALSFIGLGGVLVGVGLVYQRLLFPKGPTTEAPA